MQGNGRTSELRSAKSNKNVIDKTVTVIRKKYEDNWVRTLHTQFPYGLNDRIDGLKDKWQYNCEFAKFLSPKNCERKRSWKKASSDDQIFYHYQNIIDRLIFILKSNYNSSVIMILKRLLFPLKKNHLINIQKMYFEQVFTDDALKNEALYKQSHFVISDLLMYKIKPFHKSKVTNIYKSSKKRRQNFKLLFVNKCLDMINLPLIFRNKELKSYVNFCNICEPSVQYSYRSGIGSKIFNYNQTVDDFQGLDDIECICSQSYFKRFINDECGHVVTGDISIFSSDKLRNLVRKGPKYREPAMLDFDVAKKSILDHLDEFVTDWAEKEHFSIQCFEGWKTKFVNLLEETVSRLKIKYQNPRKYKSVFKDSSVEEELIHFHKNFVLCPVDKASKNIAVICKKFYCKTILNECLHNVKSYCQVIDHNTGDICSSIQEFVKEKFSLDISSGVKRLPHIVLFPKFHKPKFSQRFVVSYANCFIKPLASRLTLGLKAVFKKICNYSSMILKVTGISRNWVIENNASIRLSRAS